MDAQYLRQLPDDGDGRVVFATFNAAKIAKVNSGFERQVLLG